MLGRRTAFDHCCPSDRRGAKVLCIFNDTDTDIAADLHETDGGETLILRHAAQNITPPHSSGIAVSCTSTGHVLENAGKSEDSQNKFVPIATWQCHASATWWKWSHGDVRCGLSQKDAPFRDHQNSFTEHVCPM